MQGSALEGDERHPVRACRGIELLQESPDARLARSDLRPLLAKKCVPALRPLPAGAAGDETADAVDRDGRARDAPFDVGPVRRGGVRPRQLVRHEFGRLAQDVLQRGER